MSEISKIKLGTEVYQLKDAEARANKVIANPEDTAADTLTKLKVGENIYSIDSGSTVTDSTTNGNIVVDGEEVIVYEMPQIYKDYLDEAVFKKPTIETFQLLDDTNNILSGKYYEYGTTLTISKIKHKETNITNIANNLLFVDLAVAPSAIDAIVDLTDSIEVTSSVTYNLTGADTRSNVLSRSAAIAFNRYAYSKLTTDTTSPVSDLTKQAEQSSFKSNGADFTYTKGQYLYIYLTESGKQAQTNVLGQWVNVTSDESSALTITQENGATYTYYAYKIGPFVADGTAKYRVK